MSNYFFWGFIQQPAAIKWAEMFIIDLHFIFVFIIDLIKEFSESFLVCFTYFFHLNLKEFILEFNSMIKSILWVIILYLI
jgi:hypothetical protein